MKYWIPDNQYKRKKKKLLKQTITVVFNYSKIELTKSMEDVLNRGLKFAILPLKLDVTQVLTDFRRFERTLVWKEFWHGRDTDNTQERETPTFKKKKNNFPRNYKTPQDLQNYLAAVKSDILDPKNRNVAEPNLPKQEVEALKKLINFQRDRIIVIKPCDKGAGIIILDFEEYIRVCTEHLESKTPTGEKYYTEVGDNILDEARDIINKVVQEGFDNDILTEEEFKAMTPEDNTVPGRFYGTFKVHKPHENGKAPPI